MKIDTLKFPTDEFTHTDLAAFNNTTNQAIWKAYDEARKNNVIVPTGNKKGKATYYKLADASQATAGVIPASQPKVEVVVADDATPIVVEVAKVEPEVVIPVALAHETFRPVIVSATVVDMEDTDCNCPFCNTKMKSYSTPSGVMVFCPEKDLTICKSSENPYGHGRNLKEAYQTACDKFSHVDA